MSSSRRGFLALAFQEAFTAVARVRANRQVATDAESFRSRFKQVLTLGEQEARRAGYTDEDVRFALFAIIGLLDETVLNSQLPIFAEWPRKPLQEEVFGGMMAGELFFQYLQQLLGRPDAEDLADLLEVYQLCLLLGFKGRYGAARGTELQVIAAQVADRMNRIRGATGELSPRWRPSTEAIGARRDVLVRWLAGGALIATAAAIVLFVLFSVTLRGGMADLQALAARIAA